MKTVNNFVTVIRGQDVCEFHQSEERYYTEHIIFCFINILDKMSSNNIENNNITPPPSPASTIDLFIGGEDSMDTQASLEQQQPTTSAPSPPPLPPSSDLLSRASAEDLETIQSLLSDEDIEKLGEHIGEEVLWDVEPFISKLGFSAESEKKQRANALRAAKNMAIDMVRVSLSQAVGKTEIENLPVVNPVSVDRPSNDKNIITFMTSMNLLMRISGVNTESGKKIRKALWWLFFAIDRQAIEQLKEDVRSAKQQVCKINHVTHVNQ